MMDNLLNALGCIDEDLVADAIRTINVRRDTSPAAKTVRWKAAPGGNRRTKAIVISVCTIAAAIICALVVMWCMLTLRGSSALDPGSEGNSLQTGTFETFSELFPDAGMAERITSLPYEDAEVELYYNDGTDWQDTSNWNKLRYTADTGETLSNGTIQRFMMSCMFTGTLDDYIVTYVQDSQEITVGDTAVTLEHGYGDETSATTYAFFEMNGIIYDLRVQYGSTAEAELMSVLDILLA